jgi:hypothetical protein
MTRKILGWLAVALLAVPMAAGAVTTTWTLSNAVFSDGTTATGWFTYDSNTSTAVDWSIVTQDGTKSCCDGFSGSGGPSAFAGYTYDLASSLSYPLQPNSLIFNALNGPSRYLNLGFVNALPSTGGSVALGTVWPFTGSTAASSYECDNCSYGRYLTSGTLTTSVPEPGTLALLGLGFAGLGFSRRRKTA